MTSLASLTGVSTSSLKDAERPSIDPAPDTPNEETPLLDGILPPIPAVTAIKEYARPGTPPEMIAETPPLISDIPARPGPSFSSIANVQSTDDHTPGQIPLLLTPRQKLMVKNLNEGLPQVERLIAWFPWAFNAHALLIARSVVEVRLEDELHSADIAAETFSAERGRKREEGSSGLGPDLSSLLRKSLGCSIRYEGHCTFQTINRDRSMGIAVVSRFMSICMLYDG